ncbi:Isochorismatase hydrolase [Terfezia boudieri ATCC MYA-4762]|uniref:Isochorismatase hydrolase n=1 Tax=Terfezia boudieri ATCC MYA-4762 TaxID=1051890 RepID=A0A3N4LCV6_9PEZI|nr:Isochorismatase hydrolase [Terfezia boudieri ATCC MYA-4762]
MIPFPPARNSICDIQEGFRNAIHEFPTVISTATKLLQASVPLQIPTVVTEQNPSRLGTTIPEISSLLSPSLLLLPPLPKTLFSMMLPQVLLALRQQNITSVAIAGIESHVCILQTCLDLLKANLEVYAISDGISSCNKEEVPIAVARMRQEGVRVTTSESWLYEVMMDSDRPEFREVLKVVKATNDSTREGLGKLCKSSL